MIFLYSTLIYVYIIIDNIFIFYIFFSIVIKNSQKTRYIIEYFALIDLHNLFSNRWDQKSKKEIVKIKYI